MLSSRLTDVAGSSAYFLGGAVTYANEAKVALVGVSPETLERHGAVSEEVAREMAAGARLRFGASVGLGVTGIAGPGGGTPDKPVGTVHVAPRRRGRDDGGTRGSSSRVTAPWCDAGRRRRRWR